MVHACLFATYIFYYLNTGTYKHIFGYSDLDIFIFPFSFVSTNKTKMFTHESKRI